MEGPSLVILREELEPFRGRKVLHVAGNTKQPKETLRNRTLSSIQTWGKQLFLGFSSSKGAAPPILLRTHFLMFGSYRINEPRPGRFPRLELKFRNGVVYFYACSIKFGVDDYFANLNPQVDLMSERWNRDHVVALLRSRAKDFLCDVFLDQTVFAGSGNIVKNEVLFNIRRHPLTRLSQIPERDWPRLADAVRDYCRNFYNWKKKFELRKHWQVYSQSRCPLCDSKLVRAQLGKFSRRTFYCPRHQELKVRARKLEVFPVLPVEIPDEVERVLDH